MIMTLWRKTITVYHYYHVLHLQESVEEWLRPEKSYKLLEMTIRVLKAGDHNQFLDHDVFIQHMLLTGK